MKRTQRKDALRNIGRQKVSYLSILIIALMGVIGGLCIAAGSCFTQLWQWYVAAVLSGASYSLNNVLVPNIVNNWFAERRGLASAVALSASGISGALFSPILARVIAALGWRSAAVVFGLAIFVLTVLPAILLLFDPLILRTTMGMRTSAEGHDFTKDLKVQEQG